MKTCGPFICRFYKSLPAEAIFTTRDCLAFGTRKEVDRILSKLVKKGHLVRLASGVFTCAVNGKHNASLLEVAEVKAKSAGKKVFVQCINEGGVTLITSGCSSRFRVNGELVVMRKAPKRCAKLTAEEPIELP